MTSAHAEIDDALTRAFAGAPIDLVPLPGGRSGATVFAFEAEGARWVVRKGELRAVACARIAADLGVGPVLRHADEATGVVIMEHVDGAPFGGVRDRAVIARVAKALRRIHDGPPFPESIAMGSFVRHVAALYLSRTGSPLPPRLVTLLDACAAETARVPLVPCHRDLNPGNVFVSPERVCLLDWDAAGAGDPFLDLALLGVFGTPAPDDRVALLEAYLDRGPTEAERTRAALAHVHALAFYALGFAYIHAVSGAAGGVDVATPVPLSALRAPLAQPAVTAASLLAEAERLAT